MSWEVSGNTNAPPRVAHFLSARGRWFLLAAVAVACADARAQFRVALEPALRYERVAEYDQGGKKIIEERGWLPGLGTSVAFGAGRHELSGAARWFKADLDYDGRLQGGRGYRTETGTALSQFGLGWRYRIFENTRVAAALAHDRWIRNIRGKEGAIGLRERTRSNRLQIGIEQEWRIAAAGKLSASLTAVRAQPEHLRIDFSGALDNVALRTRAATGYGLELNYQPAGWPAMTWSARLDSIKVPRSDAHAVTRDGRPAGELIQPEHLRQGVTFGLRYAF